MKVNSPLVGDGSLTHEGPGDLTKAEVEALKKTVIDEGQALKDAGLKNKELGPAISGAYDKSTGKTYTIVGQLSRHKSKEFLMNQYQ